MKNGYRRYEFYKQWGATAAVYTCECCRDGRYRDAWLKRDGKIHSTGISVGSLRDRWELITEREAHRRAPDLIEGWSESVR
ncbi:hypothetical protein [Rhodopseudomonas palustris]|uniref:hypothetical protein n=1 Tax=Rhodopseudomonas palustris TaxID=1076 RepID=UPI0021F37243|nr:hypothetical protein [Rhodopseudomonas palustris]UYO52528.1 hypothetical protein KQX61_18295 [Rhodopseudomonas palustris]